MDAKTQKSEMTRTAIVGAGLDIVSAEGLDAITLQVVASSIGLSKSVVSPASARARPCRKR